MAPYWLAPWKCSVKQFVGLEKSSTLEYPLSEYFCENCSCKVRNVGKRSMYGRAKLPLLRARVLHVAEKKPAHRTILAG